MSGDQRVKDLASAVKDYLELMYTCDVSRFALVFHSTAQLHGFRDGTMTVWPASEYRGILAERDSPKALGALREEEILLLDFASESQAMAKVRVRIASAVFLDYLCYHLIDGRWRITAKSYHREAG